MAQLLLNAGANLNDQRNLNKQIFPFVLNGDWEMVKILLDGGADPNKAGSSGETALNWAALAGNLDMVKVLLGGGADPNQATDDGRTPLHRAIMGYWGDRRQSHQYVVEQLIDAGTDLNKPDKDGFTPLNWAKLYERDNVVNLLLERGADPGLANKRLKVE